MNPQLTPTRTAEELFAEMMFRADTQTRITLLALDFDHFMKLHDYVSLHEVAQTWKS